MKILLLLTGGAIGTLSRYLISGISHQFYLGLFPIGTLIVNISGSFLIGLLWGIFETTNIPSHTRTFLFIGVLGGFTTFSSYTLESIGLFRDGEIKLALLNILANNGLGLLMVIAGLFAAKGILNAIN